MPKFHTKAILTVALDKVIEAPSAAEIDESISDYVYEHGEIIKYNQVVITPVDDDGNPILFQVPEDVHNTLTSWGYDLDEAETTADCAGYSAFIEQGGREFYSFAVLDRRNDQDDLDPDGRLAFQCYVTHEDFHVLAEGDYYGTKADGINHLTVGSQSVDTDQIQHVLERLFEAVRTFSKEHPADA